MSPRSLPAADVHPALAALPAAGFDGERVADVLACYDEPQRVYHDRAHIAEMLQAVQELRTPLTAAQALAVLFHDAVYETGSVPRGSNERRSAELLRRRCSGLPGGLVEAACAIVLDTVDHLPRHPESPLVLDLDLMRLGAAPDDFERYSRQVLAEQRPHMGVADDAAAWRIFCEQRTAFFERLLARPSIYRRPEFVGRFERPARENLAAAVAMVRPPA